MASIEKVATKDATPRYRVRWWEAGRRCEKWLPTMTAARKLKTRLEADALEGVSVDFRAGDRVLNDYFAGWLDTRLVKGRPLTAATKLGYRDCGDATSRARSAVTSYGLSVQRRCERGTVS